jgi:hypothetical protein
MTAVLCAYGCLAQVRSWSRPSTRCSVGSSSDSSFALGAGASLGEGAGVEGAETEGVGVDGPVSESSLEQLAPTMKSAPTSNVETNARVHERIGHPFT